MFIHKTINTIRNILLSLTVVLGVTSLSAQTQFNDEVAEIPYSEAPVFEDELFDKETSGPQEDTLALSSQSLLVAQPSYQNQPQINVQGTWDNTSGQVLREMQQQNNQNAINILDQKRIQTEKDLGQDLSAWGRNEASSSKVEVIQQRVTTPVIQSPVANAQQLNVVTDSPAASVFDSEDDEDIGFFNSTHFSKGNYMGLFVGSADYNHPRILGRWSLGLELGSQKSNGMDTGFYLSYSDFDMDPYRYVFDNLTQYGAGVNMRYRLLSGNVTPYFGFSGGLSYKSYGKRNADVERVGYKRKGRVVMEVAPLAGCEVVLSRSFSIRGEAKYVKGVLGNRTSGDIHQAFRDENKNSHYFKGDDYYLMGIIATFKF